MKKIFAMMSIFAACQLQAQEEFTVYFDFDIDEANETSGKKLSRWIAENPNVSITKIYGYTDSVGEAIYNTDLSERRADYVYKQLKEAAILTDGADKKGLGETKATGKSAKDRKVVVYYNQVKAVAASVPPPVTPMPVQVPKPATDFTKAVAKAVKGDKIRVPNLNFYNNSDIFLPASHPVLYELLTILKENPKLKIDIQGHICCQKREDNQISQKRALATYNFLAKNGISRDRLSYKSFGSSRPIYALPEKNDTEREANRRVEIEIVEN